MSEIQNREQMLSELSHHNVIPQDVMKAAWRVAIDDLCIDDPGQTQVDAVKAIARAILTERERSRAALSAQVQDVAGWKDISMLYPENGMIVMGWGEYRERDGFSPAFMRWSNIVNGWSVNAMPFFPTHWMPLPASPASKHGDAE